MQCPDLKAYPRYGIYPWWPEDGDDWLHPDDVQTARAMIPSMRVFRREGEQPPYVVQIYGDSRLRVRRTLWQQVAWEGIDIGDWVEVKSRGQKNEFRTGQICEMLWDPHSSSIRYQIEQAQCHIETYYSADDLRPVTPTSPSRWSQD